MEKTIYCLASVGDKVTISETELDELQIESFEEHERETRENLIAEYEQQFIPAICLNEKQVIDIFYKIIGKDFS